MTIFKEGTQLQLPLKTDYRKTVTDICVKTLAAKAFQQIKTKTLLVEEKPIDNMRLYINSHLKK